MRVVKARRNGIVRRVTAAAAVTRFLSHLSDAGSSPNTICAHSYDLRHLVSFLDKPAIGWNELRASTPWRTWRTCSACRPSGPCSG